MVFNVRARSLYCDERLYDLGVNNSNDYDVSLSDGAL